MNQGTKAGMKLDDAALIEELRKHSNEAAKRYLEHVVVSKKSPNKKLHHELLENLFLEAEEQLANDGVRYHLEELGRYFTALSLLCLMMCRFRIPFTVGCSALLCFPGGGRTENANQVDPAEAPPLPPGISLLRPHSGGRAYRQA
jgi:hypothetical protein